MNRWALLQQRKGGRETKVKIIYQIFACFRPVSLYSVDFIFPRQQNFHTDYLHIFHPKLFCTNVKQILREKYWPLVNRIGKVSAYAPSGAHEPHFWSNAWSQSSGSFCLLKPKFCRLQALTKLCKPRLYMQDVEENGACGRSVTSIHDTVKSLEARNVWCNTTRPAPRMRLALKTR
jgi:hypothetical protein